MKRIAVVGIAGVAGWMLSAGPGPSTRGSASMVRGFSADTGKFVPVYEGPFSIMSTYPNIDVNPAGNRNMQGETAIAINPTNPNMIIAGSNDDRSNGGSPGEYVYLSTNGGTTWSNFRIPGVPNTYYAVTDPSLAYDADGQAYFGFGAFHPTTNASAVYVQHSGDGGKNWDQPVAVQASTMPSFEDKYIIAADANTSSPAKNNVYVSWTHFMNQGTSNQTNDIFFSRSTNRGSVWSSPQDLGTGHLSMPVTGPNGEVYVVWSKANGSTVGIGFAASTNGGASFSTNRTVQTVYNLPSVLTSKNNMRMITYPVAAVDNSTVHKGRIYIAWAGLNGQGGAPHIFAMYSDNRGSSWSSPQMIDGDNFSGNDKFHPWITCDPISGVVAVSYYDSQNDVTNQDADCYVAISGDGGTNWTPMRISNTSFPINPTQGYWADYTAIAAYKGKIMPCWTDQRGGTSVLNTDVYVSVIGLGPNAVKNLTASTGAETPTGAVLRWIDPTTKMSGDPLTNFTIAIFRDNVYVATVAKGTQTYLDNGLTSGSTHSWQVYVASNGDTSQVATTTTIVGGALQPKPATLVATRETPTGTDLTFAVPNTHVDGTPLYDLAGIRVYVDGVGQLVSLLPTDTGKTVTKSITLTQSTIHKFHAYSTGIVAIRGSATTESVRGDTVIWYAGSPLTAMNEGFESSPVLGVNAGWKARDTAAHTGAMSLCDNSGPRSLSRQNIYAILPPVIVQSGQTEFSFWHMAIVATSDSAIVEMTTDHGATWTKLARYTIASGPFSDTLAKSQWKNEIFNFKNYVGDTIAVRFRMWTGPFTHKTGWFVDDVTLRAPTAVNELALAPTDLALSAAPNPFRATATINVGPLPAGIDRSSLRLTIVDETGRTVADLTDRLRAGDRAIPFRGDGLPAGSYFARLRAGGAMRVARLSLVK